MNLRYNTRFALLLCGFAISNASAQQVTVGVPMLGMSDSFFESHGTRFGVRYDSPTSRFFFNFGGSVPAAFGGFDPNTAASFGTAGRRGNWSWDLGFTAAQGSSRSLVSTTPMLTLPNGGSGFITNSTIRPFVTGIVPVVNDRRLAALTAEYQLASMETQREHFRQRFANAVQEVAAKRHAESARHQRLVAELEQKRSQRRSSVDGDYKVQRRTKEPPLVLRGK